MKILHIRSVYLGIPFLYYLLKSLTMVDNYILVRKFNKNDIEKFPFNKQNIIYRRFNIIFVINLFCILIFRLSYLFFDDSRLFYKKIKKIAPDVLHAHMGQEGYYSLSFARKLNIPLITTFYGADMSSVPKIPYWKKKYNKLFRLGSAFIVEGKRMKDELIKIGCKEKKIYVVPITIPLKKMEKYIIEEYKDTKVCKILMVANFYEKKGYRTAINVFLKLIKNNFSLKVGIVGDGLLRGEIMEMVRSNKLKNVKFYGKLKNTEIYKLARTYNIFFHPSETSPDGDTEGGAPTIILEMQYIGLPIVATYHRDIPNIIPKVNHYLADEKDCEELSKQIISLYTNQNDWETIAKIGRKFVLEHHAPDVVGVKMAKIYKRYDKN